MLLSRTAEDLYWLGRHLERAEGLARIVAEHTHLLIDLPVGVETGWGALLAVTGTTEAFEEQHGVADEASVCAFLLWDRDNPGSLVRTVSAARENMRVCRQLLPREAWERWNALHLAVGGNGDGCVSRPRRAVDTDLVVSTCEQVGGILTGSMSRDAVYRFIDLGRNIERADLTTRVLDVRAGTLVASGPGTGRPPADRGPYEDVRWLGVLRTLGALHMYRRTVGVSVDGDSVVDFLTRDDAFPRAVAYCVHRIDDSLHRLPDRPAAHDACGRLLDLLDGESAEPVDADGLHDAMDRLQLGLGAVHDQLTDGYFAPHVGHPVAVGAGSD